MKKQKEHTTIRNSNLFCTHCGEEYVLKYPMKTEQFSNAVKMFNVIHKDCKPEWKEPVAVMTQNEKQRADWWFAHGERGMSSESIWRFMQGIGGHYDYPYDPSDFRRCYALLKVVPEWYPRMSEMKKCGPQWAALSSNWDHLTMMFEQKDKNLYDHMQKLIESK